MPCVSITRYLDRKQFQVELSIVLDECGSLIWKMGSTSEAFGIPSELEPPPAACAFCGVLMFVGELAAGVAYCWLNDMLCGELALTFGCGEKS